MRRAVTALRSCSCGSGGEARNGSIGFIVAAAQRKSHRKIPVAQVLLLQGDSFVGIVLGCRFGADGVGSDAIDRLALKPSQRAVDFNFVTRPTIGITES